MRSPQECRSLTATAENLVVGAFACPSTLLPQQLTSPLRRTPQECADLVSTAVNPIAVDGSDCPNVLLPQQVTVLSAPTAHVCQKPALTEMKVPSGASLFPSTSDPQHATVPSTRTPQV